MNTTETSLRVRFAKALGWTLKQIDAVLKLEELNRKYARLPRRDSFSGLAIESEYGAQQKVCDKLKCPSERLPIIDSNTVREAWKTLTPEEKRAFVRKLLEKLDIAPLSNVKLLVCDVMEKLLDEEPTTLAELVCEVRNSPK
jgi:hypothetical protein